MGFLHEGNHFSGVFYMTQIKHEVSWEAMFSSEYHLETQEVIQR